MEPPLETWSLYLNPAYTVQAVKGCSLYTVILLFLQYVLLRILFVYRIQLTELFQLLKNYSFTTIILYQQTIYI